MNDFFLSQFRPSLRYFSPRVRAVRCNPRLPLHMRAMSTTIQLTDQEKSLRQLLLDVSNYISGIDGQTRPELRFTGGWVRDKLLGLDSKDIDIGISSMTGYKFGTLMKKYLKEPESRKKYPHGVLGGLAKIDANPEKSKHLETVTTRILGLDIDLVNLRKETYDEASRNPTMDFGSPEDDASRRDATVNALFYNLTTSEVEDYTGNGLKDMELKIIRTPLAPYQTFKDDPLRILRCIRFACKLGYRIDAEAEQSMSDANIKEALRVKISRERVGIEVEKMLRGPDPHMALCLLDRLNLYNTIFTDPTNAKRISADTERWSRAYNQMLEISKADSNDDSTSTDLTLLKSLLIRNPEDLYLTWMLCALVPWADFVATSDGVAARSPLALASTIVRQGLKSDNKVTKVVENAALYRKEITSFSGEHTEQGSSALSTKRKREESSREDLGMAIRRWGPRWRSNVLFAILVEVASVKEGLAQSQVIARYARWLSHLQSLNLLEAHALKPLVDGEQLKAALELRPGPWMKKGLDIAMQWQLRNPNDHDPRHGVAEVISRKSELGLP